MTILPWKEQDFHIKAINMVLANKIAKSSPSDPVVIQGLMAMNEEKGEPSIP